MKITSALAAAGLFAAMFSTASPVYASDDAATTLPSTLTALERVDIPFSVSAVSAVCSVRGYNGATVQSTTEGAYVLTVDPGNLGMGTRDVTVVIDGCDGWRSLVDVTVHVPFSLDTTKVIAPQGQYGHEGTIRVRLETAPDSPVTVEVLRDSQPVKAFTAQSGSVELAYRVPTKQAGSTWAVRSTGPQGTATRSVIVANGWAPLFDGETWAHPACSTLTWRYTDAKAPKTTKTFKAELRKGLSILEAATGLTFVEAAEGEPATLTYDWQDLRNSSLGEGGMSVQVSEGKTEILSSVTFNNKARGMRNPGYGRASNGVPNRGHVILHETAHALGLGHVRNPKALMNPTMTVGGPTGLTKGERAGLAHLYKPHTCQ